MISRNILIVLMFALLGFCSFNALANTSPATAVDSLSQSVPFLSTQKGSTGIPAVSVTVNPDGSEDYSVTLQILALMTALGFFACHCDFNDILYPHCGGDVDFASSVRSATNAI